MRMILAMATTLTLSASLLAFTPAQPPPAAPTTPATPPAPGTPPATAPAATPAKPVTPPPAAAVPPPIPAQPAAKPATPAEPVQPPAPAAPVTTADGLIIQDLVVGTGDEAKADSWVVTDYTGTLKATGAKFDSSHDRNAPFTFQLSNPRLIKAWHEGIPGMKVGGKRKLTVPAALAYGSGERHERNDGTGKLIIPANSDLVFEIDLLGVLVIDDTVVGTGEAVKPGANVTVNYRGTLRSDGTEFDASKPGQPATFSLTQVIPGWSDGLVGMKVGGKRKLIVPWRMAYGERGSPPKIGPKADLVFEVELVKIN